MAEFAELEAQDGIRFTFNILPSSSLEASKCIVPIAAVYTPLHSLYPKNKQPLPYSGLRCRTCSAFICPYAQIDFTGKLWVCPFCFQRNHFPQHYQQIAENNLPPELLPQYSTCEYIENGQACLPPPPPPVFLFVVDTCLIEEELEFLKTSLRQAMELVPENAFVGIITFGAQVHLHELGCIGDIPRAYVFRGSKEITKDTILTQLGLQPKAQQQKQQSESARGVSRFLVPKEECEYNLGELLEDLQRDAWAVEPGHRPMRCTGMALTIASGLLGACLPRTGARIMAFLGGPCTEGPGIIVSKELSNPIRSHKDLDNSPIFQKALNFYEGLSKQLVEQGHVLDVFACALDQVGIAEMKVAIERTGGLVVMAESFGHLVFKDSLRRVFDTREENNLGLSFNGTFEVICSKDVKIQGIIGPCTSLEKKGTTCSDIVIGQGNTTTWKMCGLDRNTSLTIFLDTAASTQPIGGQCFLQLITKYQHYDGKMHTLATTVTRRWANGANMVEDLASGFDQETATVVFARLASYKMEMKEEFEAIRWLDRSLIRLCSRFGEYQKDNAASFTLNARFALLPQFMFNLRRSQFVQVFNNSPDETAYYRILLNRENVTNSMVMIQPTLMCYSLQSPPEPALLDVAAISPDRILVLDAYFTVVVFHGMHIAQWRNAGYHKQPQYQNLTQLLKEPQEDAQTIIRQRFPAPRMVVCDQHGSQARFLLAKLNPSASYKSAFDVPANGDIIFTDDVSLQVFVEHLQMLAVKS